MNDYLLTSEEVECILANLPIREDADGVVDTWTNPVLARAAEKLVRQRREKEGPTDEG